MSGAGNGVDLSLPASENLRSLMRTALSNPRQPGSIRSRVAALNSLVSLLRHWRQSGVKGNQQLFTLCGHTMEQILLGARCLLTSDAKEVRTGALRVVRYLVRDLDDIYLLVKLHIDTLIARSLDIVVGNRVERMQCLRLINHLLIIFYKEAARLPDTRSWSDSTETDDGTGSSGSGCKRSFLEWTSPYSFPHAVIRPLLALSLQGLQEQGNRSADKLCRAGTGLLCELAIVCPDLVLSVAGTGWLLRALLGSVCSQPRLGEVVTAVATRWLDRAAFRRRKDVACLLDELVAPLTDPGYPSLVETPLGAPPPSSDDERILGNCRVALSSLLRTWPGLLTALAVSEPISSRHSPLALLVDSLGTLGEPRTRAVIVEILAMLLGLRYAEWEVGSWEEAMELREEAILGDAFEASLGQNYVIADAEPVVDSVSRTTGAVDLLAQFRALALLGLLNAGVLEALVRVVLTEQDSGLGLKSTLLLADISRMTKEWLGGEWREVSLSVTAAVAAFCAPPTSPTITVGILQSKPNQPNLTSGHIPDSPLSEEERSTSTRPNQLRSYARVGEADPNP